MLFLFQHVYVRMNVSVQSLYRMSLDVQSIATRHQRSEKTTICITQESLALLLLLRSLPSCFVFRAPSVHRTFRSFARRGASQVTVKSILKYRTSYYVAFVVQVLIGSTMTIMLLIIPVSYGRQAQYYSYRYCLYPYRTIIPPMYIAGCGCVCGRRFDV
jgi:hypothetical protein